MQILDETVKTAVTDRLQQLETHLDGDVAFFYGSIDVSVMRAFRDFVERMAAARSPDRNKTYLLSQYSWR